MAVRVFGTSFILLVVMVLVLAIAFQVFKQNSPQTTSVSLTGGQGSLIGRLRDDLNRGETGVRLTQEGTTLTLQDSSGRYEAPFSDRIDVMEFLRDSGIPTASLRFKSDVKVNYQPPSQIGNWLASILSFLPLLVFGALLFFMMLRGRRRAPFPPDKYDQLRKIAELKDAGILSEGEFQDEKRKLLRGD